MSTKAEITGVGPHDGLRLTLETEIPVNSIILVTRQDDGRIATSLTNLREDPLTTEEMLTALAQLGADLFDIYGQEDSDA